MAGSSTKFTLPDDYMVDVHTHAVPTVLRDAFVDSGHPTTDRGVIVHGFPTPEWDVEQYLRGRDEYNYHFSVLSITAPGVNFLAGNGQAAALARKLNEYLASLMDLHPTRFGAFGILPIPDVENSLAEIAYCLDKCGFEGIGLYTNYNGVYLGDPSMDIVLQELNQRKATIFVHPTAPEPEGPTLGLAVPAMEYTFDTTRAISNLVLNDTVTKFPDIKFIFSHGGGTLPYLADRLAGILQIPLKGRGGKNPKTTMKAFKSFYFDLATSCSHPQLAAMNSFLGPENLLIGSDVPYFPERGLPQQQKDLASFGFTNEQLKMIKHGNALSLFPKLLSKLERLSSKSTE